MTNSDYGTKVMSAKKKAPARRKPARKPVTRYREAFAGAAKRNSGGKY